MPSEPLIDLQLASLPAEPGFRPAATAAFHDMVKAAGTTVYRMPSSAGLYVRQYLGKFEPERDAALEALKRGIPERIAQFAGKDGYEEFLKDETDKMVADAGLEAGLARGAVECWAAGVGRRLVAAPPPARTVPAERADKTAPAVSGAVKTVMTAIAAAGGFAGGFVATGLIPLLKLYADVGSGPMVAGAGENVEAFLLFATAFNGTIGGMFGAVGAGTGWVVGRGDDKPWVGFMAAFGGAVAFGGTVAALFGAGLIAYVVVAVFACGAALRAASSGGHRD